MHKRNNRCDAYGSILKPISTAASPPPSSSKSLPCQNTSEWRRRIQHETARHECCTPCSRHCRDQRRQHFRLQHHHPLHQDLQIRLRSTRPEAGVTCHSMERPSIQRAATPPPPQSRACAAPACEAPLLRFASRLRRMQVFVS